MTFRGDRKSASEVPISEDLVRVVAASVESLLRSRPGLTTSWLLEPRAGSGYKSGQMYVELTQEVHGDALPHWEFTAMFSRDGKRLLTLVYFTRLGEWWHLGEKRDVSQKEAERLAASVFTRGAPVVRVSDAAIAHARRLLSEAKEDA